LFDCQIVRFCRCIEFARVFEPCSPVEQENCHSCLFQLTWPLLEGGGKKYFDKFPNITWEAKNTKTPPKTPLSAAYNYVYNLILTMGPYTSEAQKAQYLTYCEIGLKNTQAAEKSGVTRATGHNI
jgi:hypothetical protein